MQQLQKATQDLREAIQAMAQKPAGPDRNRAIDEANEAILEAQRAMIALPPQLRQAGGAKQNEAREMEKLKSAAQRLRESVQAMAQQPAGERRNQAADQARQALFDTQQAMIAVASYQPSGSQASARGSTASSGAGSQGRDRNQDARASSDAGSTSSGKGGTRQPDVYGVLVVPLHYASNDRLADGCWVRLYENPEFGGSNLTLVGPVDVADLKRTAAHDWNGVDSLVVGSAARVTAYENESFRDKAVTIDAGKRVPHLRNKDEVSYLGRLESVRVACTGSRTG